MQGLEKILEEMRGIKDGNRKEKLYAKYPPNSKDQKVLNAYSQGYEDGTDNFYNAVVYIIRKHMDDAPENGGWIPVEERLPEKPENGYQEPEYNVMIKGAIIPTTLKFTSKGKWKDDLDQEYEIIAWRPLPDPYRPEGSDCDGK